MRFASHPTQESDGKASHPLSVRSVSCFRLLVALSIVLASMFLCLILESSTQRAECVECQPASQTPSYYLSLTQTYSAMWYNGQATLCAKILAGDVLGLGPTDCFMPPLPHDTP